MAKDFTTGSFVARWGFAAALVFGTYNPSGYSYIGWLMSEGVTFGPVLAIVGLVLLIAWIIYLRATLLSLGWLGVSLGAALFAAIIWLLVDIGWLSIHSLLQYRPAQRFGLPIRYRQNLQHGLPMKSAVIAALPR